MSQLRRFGLACAFAVTLAGGVLVSRPAEAITLNTHQCARLEAAIRALENLAAKYPDSDLIAFLLQQARDTYATYCS
jgi:hypothetical protein